MKKIKPIGELDKHPIISRKDIQYLENYESGRISSDEDGFETAQLYMEYITFIHEGETEPRKVKHVNNVSTDFGGGKVLVFDNNI